MNCVIKVSNVRATWWKDHMSSLIPEYKFYLNDEDFDKNTIDFVIVWKPEDGWLGTFKNLKCIISMGSGIDHILKDPFLPRDIPIIKTTGHDLGVRMREYVVLNVLRHHRDLSSILEARKENEWKQIIEPPAHERCVGIMGLGNLGSDCAQVLSKIGFNVYGWSKSKKNIEGVKSFTGQNELSNFIKNVEILVCMLPLTSETKGILNSKLFSQMQDGSCIVNAARGEHLVDDDLLQALNEGKIKEATLDVFHTEPLPSDHPFWKHPKILITPHIASLMDPVAGGKEIAKNMLKFAKGENIKNLIPLGKEY